MSDYMVQESTGSQAVRYRKIVMWIHWITAVLLIMQVYIGFTFHDLPRGSEERAFVFGWHKTWGALILLFALLRRALFRLAVKSRLTSVLLTRLAIPLVLLLVCCGVWGLQQVLIKAIVHEVPPLWQATLRFGGATALLLLGRLSRALGADDDVLGAEAFELCQGLLLGALADADQRVIGLHLVAARGVDLLVHQGLDLVRPRRLPFSSRFPASRSAM